MSKDRISKISVEATDQIICMAWEDRTSFDEIERKAGVTEAEVIKIMRRELKPSSFRMWRKRVSGRKTKHEKPFRAARAELKENGF